MKFNKNLFIHFNQIIHLWEGILMKEYNWKKTTLKYVHCDVNNNKPKSI